ncbi:hypothetical protein A2U01_0070599, partial [Trifolium medium]|nr:hypothetical protein [Trifolium medium]
ATTTEQGWSSRLGIPKAAGQIVQDVCGLCSPLQREILHCEALDGARH